MSGSKLCLLRWAVIKGVVTICVHVAKDQVDFFFAENGLVAYKQGKLLATESLKTWLGEDKLKALLNFILHYVADLDIPIKRGTFIEFRNGMLNVSPIGRNCSQEERDEFERFDHGAGIRHGSSLRSDILKPDSLHQCQTQAVFCSCLLHCWIIPPASLRAWASTNFCNGFQQHSF